MVFSLGVKAISGDVDLRNEDSCCIYYPEGHADVITLLVKSEIPATFLIIRIVEKEVLV